MTTNEEYEELSKRMHFELIPRYLDGKLSWGIMSILDWDSIEEAEGFIEYLTKKNSK